MAPGDTSVGYQMTTHYGKTLRELTVKGVVAVANMPEKESIRQVDETTLAENQSLPLPDFSFQESTGDG